MPRAPLSCPMLSGLPIFHLHQIYMTPLSTACQHNAEVRQCWGGGEELLLLTEEARTLGLIITGVPG